MTPDDTLRRVMPIWLEEHGARRVPDHLDEVLRLTAATRQRPWWSSPERWLPVDLTIRPALFAWPSRGRVLVLAAAVVLLVTALLAAGVGRQQLAPPFGLARNGAWVGSADGDLFRVDPTTGQRTPLLADTSFDFGSTFSRDGSRFAFLRSEGVPGDDPPLTLAVADADGTHLKVLTEPMRGLDWFDWSADSVRFVFIAKVDDVPGVIHVADVDSGVVQRLDIGHSAHYVTWLPPRGDEILFTAVQVAESDPLPALFAVGSDGNRLRQVSKTAAQNPFDYQAVVVAPDGSTVAFNRWSSDGIPSVVLLDPATGAERTLPRPAGTGQKDSAFSPDGTRIAYIRVSGDGSVQVVVASTDGTDAGIALGPLIPGRADGTSIETGMAFVPDATGLIVNYGRDTGGVLMFVPVDGTKATPLGNGSFAFVDVQRRAP